LQDFPMTKPLPAKAEVALEYPDKLYIGTFDRDSRFDAHLDGKGLSLVLERVGDADTRKSIHMHLSGQIARLEPYDGPSLFSYGFRPFFLFGSSFADSPWCSRTMTTSPPLVRTSAPIFQRVIPGE
jgi:hypothetical protein